MSLRIRLQSLEMSGDIFPLVVLVYAACPQQGEVTAYHYQQNIISLGAKSWILEINVFPSTSPCNQTATPTRT